jgi:CO/xanthine dehydrogenase Mo-binding subunit
MLLATAAKRWGVDPQSLRTQAGQVIGLGKKLGYGELADEAMKMPVPQQVKLKDVKDFASSVMPRDGSMHAPSPAADSPTASTCICRVC